MQASPTGLERSELDQLRLENETLSGVVSLVGSSPDLRHVLDRVVDLLTKASACHACFIYVLTGDRLRLRAASPVFGHLVGRIEFGTDEGLAGWAVRHATPAFIKERALEDPRTNNIPALEEERFQSMVAVPIPSRAGAPLGVIVLHTVAPREFDEGIINVLTHAGSLVAGAIENAQLYEESQRRVEALTELSNLSEEIAAASTPEQLHRIATDGVKELLGCTECLLFESKDDERLQLVAAAPASSHRTLAVRPGVDAILSILEGDSRAKPSTIASALGLDAGTGEVLAVPIRAGTERIGLLVAVVPRSTDDLAGELLRSVAHQIALATKKAELIERLTEDNLARDFFDALEAEDAASIASLAHVARVDVDRASVMLEVRPDGTAAPQQWPKAEQAIELALRRSAPGTVCDPGPVRLRALVPLTTDDPDQARRLLTRLAPMADSCGVLIGASCPGRGTPHLRRALTEASDAATVSGALETRARVLFYGDMGAYRYLVNLVGTGGPRDHLRAAVELLVAYDDDRGSQLLATLEAYLEHGRSTTATSRLLIIHVNTLRQRLQRIEELTGLDLTNEDLLALHLAIKLARLRCATG